MEEQGGPVLGLADHSGLGRGLEMTSPPSPWGDARTLCPGSTHGLTQRFPTEGDFPISSPDLWQRAEKFWAVAVGDGKSLSRGQRPGLC